MGGVRCAVSLWLLLFSPLAVAGSGPWTLSPDDLSTYTGLSYTRWQHLVGADGKVNGDAIEMPSAFTRTDLGLIVTYGLMRNADLELAASLALAAVGRDDAGVCVDIRDICDTTVGLAPVTGRLKVRLLDELDGRAVTLSVGPELRFGDFTRPTRDRVTAIGDGQTDLGAYVVVGRTGGLGGGSWSGFLEVAGRYRIPITTLDGVHAPPSEVTAAADVLLYPSPNVSFGATLDGFHSLGGLDFEQLPMEDEDRFTALAGTSIKAGGKLNLRSIGNVTVSMSVLGTLYARNNPSDFVTVGFGIGTFRPSRQVN